MLKILLATASVAAATTVSLSAPAQADTPTCVSGSEFRAVSQGWRLRHVTDVFDLPGEQTLYRAATTAGSYALQTRRYDGCVDLRGDVLVQFRKKPGDAWRVVAKSA